MRAAQCTHFRLFKQVACNQCGPLLCCTHCATSAQRHIALALIMTDPHTAVATEKQELMRSPLVKSFAYNPKPHDRREALPLPLAVLAAWEEHIVSPARTPAVGLLLGALLLCAHCSLRFGDIQRAQALRGLCWATKTTNQGQPFACLPFGFRGEDISTSWLVKWLALLSQALDATQAEWGDSFVRSPASLASEAFHLRLSAWTLLCNCSLFVECLLFTV